MLELTDEVRSLFQEAGRRGGERRAAALTPERRTEIAKRAGRARQNRCMDCGAKPEDCGCVNADR